MLKHLELREWLAANQRRCPSCGKRVSEGDHLHHVFIRRMKQHSESLWHRINVCLCCASCHVPEAPGLNYAATLQKFELFTPREIRDWVASLPFKVKPGMPSWFVEAEEEYERQSRSVLV